MADYKVTIEPDNGGGCISFFILMMLIGFFVSKCGA